jgi:penicillin-binding protein 2
MTLKKIAEYIRAFLFFALTLAVLALGVVRLMKIQVVDGDSYVDKALLTRTAEQVINSPRGEITDINGMRIVSNKVGYNVIFEKAFYPEDNKSQNAIIAETAAILKSYDAEWIDTLPISRTRPYEFYADRESDIAKMRKNINVQPYATASDCIEAMKILFGIDSEYSLTEIRNICGIRHEMMLRSFSLENTYTFAEDIPLEAVAKIKELSFRLQGTDVVAEAVRVVNIGDVAPHLIGSTGMISTDEYEKGRETDLNYALNDSIGKSGIELALESELRGIKGVRTFTLYNNEVVSDEITTPAVPGHSVKLTFDIAFQRDVQETLMEHILWLQNQDHIDMKGTEATGGAFVVLDASGDDAGAVLASASYPTYNLADYKTSYAALGSDPTLPLYNRATSGLYRPGSTFKTVTATAALNEGYIDLSTYLTCNHVYTYWSDYQPRCTGWHGRINVVTALEKSCNIFFYEVGRVMGIDLIDSYAALYGLGEPTGLETGGQTGWVASPALFEQKKLDWQAGLVVQAAIGQSETNVTPMQLAVLANTIANDGVRYRPHLLDSVWDYNLKTIKSRTMAEVLSTIDDKSGITFSTVKKGMAQAANFFEYSYPTELQYGKSYLLSDIPGGVAIKTGTPQMTSAEDTGSAFIGYYPADNPEIAFAGFIEHGEWSKLMIREMIMNYIENYKI